MQLNHYKNGKSALGYTCKKHEYEIELSNNTNAFVRKNSGFIIATSHSIFSTDNNAPMWESLCYTTANLNALYNYIFTTLIFFLLHNYWFPYIIADMIYFKRNNSNFSNSTPNTHINFPLTSNLSTERFNCGKFSNITFDN